MIGKVAENDMGGWWDHPEPWHGVQTSRESKVSRVVIFSLRDDRNSRVILTQAPYLTLVQRKRPVQRLTGSSGVEPGVGGRSHSSKALSQATDSHVVVQLPSHHPGPGHQCVFLLINCTNLHWSSDSHPYLPRACCRRSRQNKHGVPYFR